MSYFQPNNALKKGKYRVIQILGGGGFGVTYLAEEQKTGKLVAIKTLNTVKHGNSPNFDELQEKFVNEALVLATFDHPHIVRVYPQMFSEAGLWCMTMEYVPGKNLIEYIEKNGIFSESEALRIISQVATAIDYIHSRNYLHRDIKPDNIILRESDGSAILLDFGLAREVTFGELDSLTNDRTKGYAPPEQYERQGNFTPALDVYALSATLYVLLTAKIPPPANYRKEFHIPVTPPQDYNPNLSTYVCNAILRGMEIDPENRPQSVQEWLDLLTPPRNPVFRFEVVTVNRRGEITHRERKEAEYYTEMLPGDVALDMVAIPGGTFLMGSPEREGFDDERPQHSVTVSPFYMGKYPITQAQWQAVASLPKIERDLKPDPSRFKGNDRPVESVSWYDAVEFCARLSKATGQDYRLPSESQWEYACRAGTLTPFHFGETLTDQLANYVANHSYAEEKPGQYREQTTPVGSFPPNAFGLYDMHGNVWEWCLDSRHDNYKGVPDNGEVWQENGNDNHSPLRGGSWLFYPYFCRSAYRDSHFLDGRDDIYIGIGFRVVCVAPRTF